MRLKVGSEAGYSTFADRLDDESRIIRLAKSEERFAADRADAIVAEEVRPVSIKTGENRVIGNESLGMHAFRRFHPIVAALDLYWQQFGQRAVCVVGFSMKASKGHPSANHGEPAPGPDEIADRCQAVRPDLSPKRLRVQKETVRRRVGQDNDVIGLHLLNRKWESQ